MNKSRKSFGVAEGKIQASILLKSLHCDDVNQSNQAVKRFQCLPEFSTLSLAEIPLQNIKRKHALNVIAIENGFYSWNDLKLQVNFIIGGHLNHWFKTYEEAKSYQAAAAGYLFPYKKQFFICSAAYMEEIGFDPNDQNWERIDFDWVRPKDSEAWRALYRKWLSNENK